MGIYIIYGALVASLGFGSFSASAADGGAMPTFAVVAKDGRLSPERLEVPAGKRIKLALKNETKGSVEFESDELRLEKVLAPGTSSSVVLPAMKPGSYRLVDEFHEDAGATLIIAK